MVVNRDLKDDNIVFRDDLTIQIMDFGLLTDEKTSNLYCGTPEYMAPEVFGYYYNHRGLFKDTYSLKKRNGELGYDKRSEFWSIGILLFRMYTGKYPKWAYKMKDHKLIVCESRDLFKRIANGFRLKYKDKKKYALEDELESENVPKDIRTIIMQCLIRDHRKLKGPRHRWGYDDIKTYLQTKKKWYPEILPLVDMPTASYTNDCNLRINQDEVDKVELSFKPLKAGDKVVAKDHIILSYKRARTGFLQKYWSGLKSVTMTISRGEALTIENVYRDNYVVSCGHIRGTIPKKSKLSRVTRRRMISRCERRLLSLLKK